MTRFLRLRRRARGQHGFTISEVSLTLLILSVILVATFDFLDRASIMTFRADAHGRAEQETQQALRLLTEHSRGAQPMGNPCTAATDTPPAATEGLTQGTLPAGYGNCMQFTVPRTTVGLDTCAKTDFVYALVPVRSAGGTVVDTYLVENRRETTGTSGSCTTGLWRSRRVLLEKVANSSVTQPLFTYYAMDGSPIAVSDTAAVKRASSLKVTLAYQYRKAAAPLVITSNVALRNNVTR